MDRLSWARLATIYIVEKSEDVKWNKGKAIEMYERKMLFFYTRDSVINLWGSVW